MSQRNSTSARRSAANTELLVLALDSIEGFFDEAANAQFKAEKATDAKPGDDAANRVYLTATAAPPVEPAFGRDAGVVCVVLSYRMSALEIACYVERLKVTALDLSISETETRQTIEARLLELTREAEDLGFAVRRGRWQWGGFEDANR